MTSLVGFHGGIPVGGVVPLRAERSVTSQRPVSICSPGTAFGVRGGWAAS